MPRLNLTTRTLDALAAPGDGDRIEYWDENLPGFGIRITPEGRKTWIVMFRFHRRLRRLTLGTYPALGLADARLLAKESMLEAARGTDPATAKQVARSAETFEELAAEYLARHAKAKKKSWKEDDRVIDRELLPPWRHLKAKDVTRRDVIRLLDGIVDRGSPIQANRTLALVRKIFNFGIQRDLVVTNPCWQIPAPSRERRRDRVLSPDELKVLWDRFCQEPETVLAPYKLMLLTAQRPGEVIGMRWKDIDLASGWWTIPGEETKNGLPHRVPLVRTAIAALKIAKLTAGDSEWVFPGRRWVEPEKRKGRQNLKRALNDLRRETGIGFRPHDLRRTAASQMTGLGVPRLVVSKILNHVERSVTAVYDRHSYDAEKRSALATWEDRLVKKPSIGASVQSRWLGAPVVLAKGDPSTQL